MLERPLRLLVVSNMYPSGSHPGYGVFVRTQVDALRALGGIEVEVFHWDARRRPWRYAVAAASHELRHADADVIHAHYGLSGFVALAAPRRIPLVLTVHGRDCHHPVVRPLTARVARRAAVVIAVSEELSAQCPFPVDEIISTGVDMELFRPLPRVQARAALGLDPDRRLLLFPADPARPEKRFADARTLVDSLIATGSSEREVELRVVFGRPREEMPLWINAADAVLVPSAREGYGLACVEALACDVPVLSTPVGIAPGLLPEVEGAFCARFELEEWRAALESILAQPDPRVKGRAVAGTQSVSATARHLVDLYRRL